MKIIKFVFPCMKYTAQAMQVMKDQSEKPHFQKWRPPAQEILSRSALISNKITGKEKKLSHLINHLG